MDLPGDFVATLKRQLTRDEGLELKPYRDNSKAIGFEDKPGKLTIGVGRNLDDVGISRDEADYLLTNDIKLRAIGMLAKQLPWTGALDAPRLGVLANMTFNEGMGHLLEFRNMLAALERSDYETAAAEMKDSLWYRQVGTRAWRLVTQMQTGVWQ
ncbi:MAG: glycoside hydrolase family protein [Terriglobales bacterium]